MGENGREGHGRESKGQFDRIRYHITSSLPRHNTTITIGSQSPYLGVRDLCRSCISCNIQHATFITSHLRRGFLHATSPSPSLPAGHVCGVVGFALEPFQDPHRLTGISAAIRLRGRREG
jgi:hypothetical protein